MVRKYHTLGIESLNVAGMIKAGLQSKALADAGMSALLNQIRYKAQRHGTRIVEADQWYPSSKTCSACEVVNEVLGREREWECPNCGVIHDRNQNAARNLRKLALLAVGEEVMLLDGGALAGDDTVAGETAPAEGRTKPRTAVNTPNSRWLCNHCYSFGIPRSKTRQLGDVGPLGRNLARVPDRILHCRSTIALRRELALGCRAASWSSTRSYVPLPARHVHGLVSISLRPR